MTTQRLRTLKVVQGMDKPMIPSEFNSLESAQEELEAVIGKQKTLQIELMKAKRIIKSLYEQNRDLMGHIQSRIEDQE